jgi:hypothetical protein
VAEGNDAPERPDEGIRAAFIVSPARSGSTLLRVLLDTHPDIVSPPELNLSALLQHMSDSWDNTNVALGLAAPRENPILSRTPSEDVAHRARKPLDEMMRTCAQAAGASVYVDKSLTTVEHLPTIAACYPEAPLIFLYRYPLDFIASGLEASRWGFNAFGFVPYVAANPGNFIAALGAYWIDRISRMLEFERTFEGSSARIYYEILCDQPRDTLTHLFDFLDVDSDDSVVERAFESEHGRGPGDYKIEFTGGISLDSVGRGATLPEHLTKEQTERINALLAELDYPELEAARRGQLAALLGLQNARDTAQEGREIAQAMVDLLERDGRPRLNPGQLAALPMEIVVARAARGEPGRVLIDPQGRATTLSPASDGEAPGRPQIRCIGDILLRVAGGEVTFGKAVHDGEIRVERETLTDTGAPPHRLLATLAALIRVSA